MAVVEAELSMEGIVGDRSEEERLTETEKNERQRKMLQVCNSKTPPPLRG